MNNELNQRRRAEEISSFLEIKAETYLKMIKRINKLLSFYLGEDKADTIRAEGIMHEIFCDIIDGTRKWDMKKFNLEQVLWTDIRSEVSALAKKEKRYVLTYTPQSEEGNNDDLNAMDNLANTSPDAIEGMIDAETLENYCRDVILKDDIDEQIIFNEMLTWKKQKQIADELGISVEKAEKSVRNIRRKISKQIPYHMIKNLPIQLIDKILNQS